MTLATLHGADNIVAFCRILMQRAERYIMISLWDTLYHALASGLQSALERGVHAKGLVMNVTEPVLGDLVAHRINPYMASITTDRWFMVSVDGRELCYGYSATAIRPNAAGQLFTPTIGCISTYLRITSGMTY